MRQFLCPILVGRDAELGVVRRALEDALAGHGGTVFLLGEAGIGKSRLAREAAGLAAASGMVVATGRAAAGAAPAPYRPFVEAALSVLRRIGVPSSPELRPFRSVLAGVLPDFGPEGRTGEESPIVLAEGFLRLFVALGGPHGCLLILEDLHGGDPESLDLLDFFVDNATGERVLCLVTMRSDEPSAVLDRVRAIRARRAAEVIELPHLSEPDAARMAAACLGVQTAPEEVRRGLATFAEGVPFLIEELLAATPGEVPASFAETVGERIEALGPEAAGVLMAAATLGRRFDWTLLPPVTG